MDSQDSATEYLFKIWPFIEANKNRILGGVAVILLLVVLALFYSWHNNQKQTDAGEAYSQMLVSQANNNSAQLANQYLKVAGDYPGTEAGQRAQLQAASELFASGNYADAQTQFQKFADEHPSSSMMGIADLGIAASLAALGKNDAAATAYKKVIDTYGDVATVTPAKFALAGIYEQQGRVVDAVGLYDQVSRSASGSALAQQASLKGVELKMTLPAPAKPSFAPTAPVMSAPAVVPSK